MDTLETFRVYRATIPLSFLHILDLYTVSSGFYESLNEENRMCELFPKFGHKLQLDVQIRPVFAGPVIIAFVVLSNKSC